jgi:signal transduction histidine kinase
MESWCGRNSQKACRLYRNGSSCNSTGNVLVEVQDTGPGLTPATLDLLFDAFYTTKAGGLGLGLSICRSIIEAHNGRLWASPNVPRGATFHFIAPAHPGGESSVRAALQQGAGSAT